MCAIHEEPPQDPRSTHVRWEHAAADPRQAIFDRARERRDEAAALRGESRQAQRQAEALRSTNVLLDTAVAMVSGVLDRGGFALAAPVVARFRAVALVPR